MRAVALLCLAAAGCYDLDSLGTLFQPDGQALGDGAGALDAARPRDAARSPLDLAGVDLAGTPPPDLAAGPAMDLAGGCAPPTVACGGGCVDSDRDPLNCGACGHACAAPPNAAPACAGGACGLGPCAPGFLDCDRQPGNGCEANLGADPANCGGCGIACPPMGVCALGACAAMGCPPPLSECTPKSCSDPRIDPDHCGGCNTACPPVLNGARACVAGHCGVGACFPHFADCDGNPANGCEVALLGDLAHCGACGSPCAAPAHGTASCVNGACGLAGCALDFGDCDGNPATGCEAALLTDARNCSACGKACLALANAQPACANGQCTLGACTPGFGDCNATPNDGCEATLATDPKNCGGCGAACAAPPHASAGCAAGKCAVGGCAPGFADCDGNAANGCEADVANDAKNCGKCGAACAAYAECVAGKCGAPVSWTAVASPAMSTLTGVWGSGPGDVYVTEQQGAVILHSQNGGFAQQAAFANHALYAVWGSSASDVYATGGFNMIAHTDGASAWAQIGSPTDLYLFAVWGSSKTDVFAVGDQGIVIHTTGANWVYANSPPMFVTLRGLWGSGPKDVYAVGLGGVIFRTADTAKTWSAQASGTMSDLYGVWGSGAGDLYAVGDGGVILHSTGNGQWAALASGVNVQLRAVWGSSAADVYAVGGTGTILHSRNGGVSWTAHKTGTQNALFAIWGSGPNDVYAVGPMGTILHLP